MRDLMRFSATALLLVACGGQQGGSTGEPTTSAAPPSASGSSSAEEEATAPISAEQGSGANDSEFVLRKSEAAQPGAPSTRPASKIKGNSTHAAMKFIVVDKESGPIPGIVIKMIAPDGTKYFTDETSAEGYAEVLVPIGQKYEIVYLSLGRKDIAASVPVTDEPNQNIRLTLRYQRYTPPPKKAADIQVGFILGEVTFDTGKATIRDESFPQLDNVAEYLSHKKSARIEISGHTDNVGNPKVNKALSLKRAQACRDYLISKGVEASRIDAVGFGDERPLAPNDSDEGRQRNRRIEAIEL